MVKYVVTEVKLFASTAFDCLMCKEKNTIYAKKIK